jgi:5-methylcytosine-specific restriction endonuclease McrA
MKKKPRRRSTCPTCKREFVHPYAYRKSKYCSGGCWRTRKQQVNIECAYCGESFWVYPSLGTRKKYCSKKCYSLHQRTRQTGAASHLWRGGKTAMAQLERTRAVYQHWRLAVFERDAFTCQCCGKRSGHGRRVILHAHHIQEFAKDLARRLDLANGVTLCTECHTLRHPHLIRRELAAKRLAQEVLPL